MIDRFKAPTYDFLRRTERYTQTDNVYLAQNGSWILAGQIGATIIALISSVAFAHLASPTSYGIYRYILTLAEILGMLSLSGLGTALTQAVARGQRGLLPATFYQNYRWSASLIIGALILAGYYAFNQNFLLAGALVVIAVCAPLIDSFSLALPFLIGKKDFRRNMFWGLIRDGGSVLAMLAVLIFRPEPLPLILTFFTSHLILTALLYFITNRIYPEKNLPDNSVLRYGQHLSLMNLITILAVKLDAVLIFHYLGAADLAIYAFATAIPDRLRGLAKHIRFLILPRFADRPSQQIISHMTSKVIKLFCFSSVITILYLLLAPSLFQLLYRPYLEAITYSQLYVLVLLGSAGIIPITFLQAHRLKYILYKFTLITQVLGIILPLLLIPHFGLLGAIVAKVIYRVSNLPLCLAVSLRSVPHDQSEGFSQTQA